MGANDWLSVLEKFGCLSRSRMTLRSHLVSDEDLCVIVCPYCVIVCVNVC